MLSFRDTHMRIDQKKEHFDFALICANPQSGACRTNTRRPGHILFRGALFFRGALVCKKISKNFRAAKRKRAG